MTVIHSEKASLCNFRQCKSWLSTAPSYNMRYGHIRCRKLLPARCGTWLPIKLLFYKERENILRQERKQKAIKAVIFLIISY